MILPIFAIAAALVLQPASTPTPAVPPGSVVIRVATFNLGDVRTADLKNPNHPRLKHLAETIQRIRPNIILLNEIAYDMPGAPGVKEGEPPGRNGQRFADAFLAVSQAGLEPLRYRAFMAPVNTGMPSGFDLDNDGRVVDRYPPLLPGAGGKPSPEAVAYGNDCWGFGTYPGQYGMALLVDERLTILHDRVRTFRLLPWDYVDGAFIPTRPDGVEPWFDEEELKFARLSSKSHWDVPVQLPGGAVVHLLCSHPTPPVFDGEEDRNGRRNHDEIRFWADYIDNAFYIVDDANTPGGLPRGASFIILGDLNADPDEGDAFKDPIGRNLFTNPRINKAVAPAADLAVEGLDPDDTAAFGLRVDYVLPSTDLEVLSSGVWRHPPAGSPFPSDHFPVWAELRIPAPLPPPDFPPPAAPPAASDAAAR